ncbi:MAG: M1 family metallopeptidase [Acidobacteriota bacterium]
MLSRIATALFTVAALVGPASAGITSQADLDRLAGAFYSPPVVDPENIYHVQNVSFTQDIAKFSLLDGTVFLTKPVEGIVRAAVFIGNGKVTITPLRPIDKQCLHLAAADHLRKGCGERLDTTISQLLLVNFDADLAGLRHSLTAKAGGADTSKAAAVLKDRFHIMRWLELPFDLALVQEKQGLTEQGTYIDFKSKDYGWLVYAFQPREQMEVSLASRKQTGSVMGWRTLIRTHKKEDIDAQGRYIADPRLDQKPLIDIQKYRMEVTIPDTQHLQVEADVTFTPLVENLPVVTFDLRNNIPAPGTISRSSARAKPIRVTSLTDESGQTLPYLHRKHSLLIVPQHPLTRGQEYTFHFGLDEETIIQITSDHYQVLNTYPWFPQYGYLGGHYAMDWTIKAKKPLVATGSGRIVKYGPEGRFNVTHLVFDQDVQFPSLIFGRYNRQEDHYADSRVGDKIALAAFSWPKTTITFTDSRGDLRDFDVTVPTSKPKSILEEAKQIIKFGEALYGPFPYDTLNIAEMAPFLGFGQSPTGFVLLTGEAFMSSQAIASQFTTLKADFVHGFFAHEISHQWWGHTISWASPEDVWLSESFAEYSAGLYVMQLLGQEAFQGKLKDWRDAARIADPHAPIAWANNVSGVNSGQWRTGLIYDKGPYVLHMLRMQIGHENYVKAMKNALAKYRFKQIKTDELVREIEAVVGYKLDYFFDQWFRETGIPKFHYTSDVRQSEDGKWLATIKISQADKDHAKIVLMPVFFHFGKDRVVVKNRPVLKAEDVYRVKLPEKPDRISLDDNRTLLADIVAEDGSAY